MTNLFGMDYRLDEDSSDEDAGDDVVMIENEDETTESENESDEITVSRLLGVAANPAITPTLADFVESREGGRIFELPDVAANIDVVSEGSIPQVSESRTALLPSADTSLSDFKSPKIQKLSSSNETEEIGDDNETCPICFEPWNNTGAHRLASLKCGHLFGKSCIMKWLKGNPGKCPQCNAKAHRRDVRVLFARTVKAVDTSERDHALKELELEREARKKAELDAARARLNYQMALAECNLMKQELERQKQQLETLRKLPLNSFLDHTSNQPSQPAIRLAGNVTYVLDKQVKIWEAGGCRVMAYSYAMTTLCISQPSSIPLFPGFGIKKINSLDFRSSQYVSIHSKAIRDLSFNSKNPDSVLLSCSIDKTIKLTSLISNQVMHTFECSAPVWSCAWNLDDRNYFYAGQQNGMVNVFDVRNLLQPVAQLSAEGSRSPVVSLQYLPQTTGTKLRPGGVLVGHLDRSEFYIRDSKEDYKLHLLPLEANLTSLSLEENTGHLLATYRPSAKHPNIRHQVCELVMEPVNLYDSQEMVCSCNIIHTFHSGSTQKLLTRNQLFLHPENDQDLLAYTGDEATQSFQVWNAASGQLQQKVVTSDSVLDLCPIIINDQSLLVALTDKQISIYRQQSKLS